MSFNGTENLIQNYCVTFSHNGNSFTTAFIVKGAPEFNRDNALKIAKILFPDYSNIIIHNIKNDELTLTPAEYEYLKSLVRNKRQASLRAQEERIKAGTQKGPLADTDNDKYLLKLIEKMDSRMSQFPTYHT